MMEVSPAVRGGGAAELKLRAETNPHNTGNRADFWSGYCSPWGCFSSWGYFSSRVLSASQAASSGERSGVSASRTRA